MLRLCAVAYARQLQWEEAFQQYRSLFELEPTKFNAMQLATTSITCGQLLRGQTWFAKVEEINRQTNEILQPKMRTHYLSAFEQAGELEAAKPKLDWLSDAYRFGANHR